MNTKLTFYCTHANYGRFEKLIFDTVLTGAFSDIYDAREWLNNQIENIYNEFDLNLVFDWIIINYHDTTEDVKEVELVKTIYGNLVFDDEIIKKVKKKRIKKSRVKEFDITPPVKKSYKSVWIDPYGKTYEVSFAGHNDFAEHWLKLNDKSAYDESDNGNRYFYEVLEKKGWCRILGWTNPPTFSLPNKIGVKLKMAIREYCLSNNVEGKYFPEILKSS